MNFQPTHSLLPHHRLLAYGVAVELLKAVLAARISDRKLRDEAERAAKELSGKKLNAPIDAYKFIEKMPADQIGYLLAETRNSGALSKIKAYLNKWRPLRGGTRRLPAREGCDRRSGRGTPVQPSCHA